MPIYRFTVDARVSKQEAAARIRRLIREPRGFLESVRHSFGSSSGVEPPFLGKIDGDSFRVRRDIRYRNSFLPLVWGRISSVPAGTQVSVTMFLHPLVTAFVLFWLSAVGFGAWRLLTAPNVSHSSSAFIPAAMFVFGVALTCGGFFPEALKARRLLEDAIQNPST